MEKEKPKKGRGQRIDELLKQLPPQPSLDPGSQMASKSTADEPSLKASAEFEMPKPTTKLGRGHYAALLLQEDDREIPPSEPLKIIKSIGRGVKSTSENLAPFGFEPADNLHEINKLKSLNLQDTCKKASTQDDSKVAEPSVRSRFHHMATQENSDKPPPVHRVGEMGKQVEVLVNYIPLSCHTEGVCQYCVFFNPPIDAIGMRRKIIKSLESALGDIYIFDGNSLFLPTRLTEMNQILKSKRPTDNEDVTLSIKLVRIIPASGCIQLYNIIFKKIMTILHMVKIGTNYFLPAGAKNLPERNLQVWPGYVTSVDEFEGGVMLCADVSHRVLRTQTCLEIMELIYKRKSIGYQEECSRHLVGNMVLTKYNNRTYRIDDIDWNASPMTKFSIGSREMSLVEYYKTNYDLVITNMDQPLLINVPSRKEQRNFPSNKAPLEKICLVPELAFMTGLTDEMRADHTVMKDLSQFTKLTPQQRHYSLMQFVNNVEKVPEAKHELQKWGFSINKSLLKVTARELPEEQVWAGDANPLRNMNSDWSRDLCKANALLPIPIKHWLLVCTSRDEPRVFDFIKYMQDMAHRMGIMISNCDFQSVPNDRTESYLDTLKRKVTEQTQIVVTVFPSLRDDRYNAIKQYCLVTRGVASQVLLTKTITNQKKMSGVSQKVALQMNCKLKGQLWRVHMPPKRTMICGVDIYHDPARIKGSCVGFVSSTNQSCTEWFSKTWFQNSGEELVRGLAILFTDAIRKFNECNHDLPLRIIIYRDGVGDGQLKTVKTFEVEQLRGCFENFGAEYKPKLAVIIVQKKINTRIMLIKNMKNDLDNPMPGTVLDHSVTRRDWYDFFIVSQRVMMGTVSPTHYIVVYDDLNWTPDQVQTITYKLTHLYCNWPGTVRVPAPCQYAHKLAYLIGQNVRKEVHENLVDRLYFL